MSSAISDDERSRSPGSLRRMFIDTMCEPLSRSEAKVLSDEAEPVVKLITSISGYFLRHSSTRRRVVSRVISSRVPMGVSSETLRRASSLVGKNSVPTCFIRKSEPTKVARQMRMVMRRWRTTHPSRRA